MEEITLRNITVRIDKDKNLELYNALPKISKKAVVVARIANFSLSKFNMQVQSFGFL
ncbi:hypothetical protein [Lysinibacillus fusiformis]|uniref:hypothetical protein n=1 Tax=Lysinibacillus fusiformis TaxID=28031 RepID=UPI00148C9213|nr:hypothetical protein [Lysinibacillus fusiformis]NOG26666.1 hypothetical protein [Lysinibacillus fusiformis]